MSRVTPHVFVSAASDDLRSARQVVKNALLTVGCHPIVQEHFEPDYRSVREMIRDRIEECDAVVHIVGKRYGGEPSPKSLPAGQPRKSWTQIEYSVAKEMGVKTFLFICDDSYPFDPQPLTEPEDEVELQRLHREQILSGEQLYVVVRSPEELALRISEMKLEAAELRKEVDRARNQLSVALENMEKQSRFLGEGQKQIMAGLADMSVSFADLADLGGIIPNPLSPEQFYHNAKLYELRGDYGNARKAYLSYFRFELDFIDPHLRFQQFLKIQEGIDGAREIYRGLVQKTRGSIAQLAFALLWERVGRIGKVEQYIENHPDFGPAWYLLSLDYSQAKLGSQTLYEKRREMECLQTFGELDERGKVARWMLDKGEVAEWREDASARLAILEQSRYAIENPVSIYWTSHHTGWMATVQITEMVREIRWRRRGEDKYHSTGFSSARCYSTGNFHPQPNFELPKHEAPGVVEIQYTNLNGHNMGPFSIEFNPLEETILQTKQILGVTKTAWVSFRDFDGKLLLYFTHLLSYRNGLSSIYYGLDKDTPDKKFLFPSHDKPGSAEIGDDVQLYMEVPRGTQFVSVSVVFKDDSSSDIQVFHNPTLT